MKKSLVFILILANSTLFACGFYPTSEDIRFSFFKNNLFGFYSFSEFNYTSNLYSPGMNYPSGYVDPNQQSWFDYCKGKVKIEDVYSALNEMSINDISENSKNTMIRYLYKTKDYEALNYLKFAINSEFGNSWEEDPWERHATFVTGKRSNQIKNAIKFAGQAKNESIKFRYLFQAMRLSYYNSDVQTINSLFQKNIKSSNRRDIIYYWSMYFQCMAEKDSALCNFYAAQVFAKAVDKRFMVSQQFNNTVPIDKTLKYAKTDDERANVYLFYGILNIDRSLEYIKKLQQLQPNSEGVSFLLLREINKIEDWVFTPYYSLFEPTCRARSWQEDENNTISKILIRVENDRVYAAKVLAFANTVTAKNTDKPLLWEIGKAYLLFVTKDYKSSLDKLTDIEKENIPTDIRNQTEIIKALDITANQEVGKAIIPNDVKPILLNNKKDQKFIFALGRELEYKGNTTDAALLYSLMNEVEWNEESDGYDNAFWKTKKNKGDHYSDFYDNYFDYMNVMYTPAQVQALLNNIIINRNNDNEFEVYKYHTIKNQIPVLYDLLGTKYIRQNRLTDALNAFRKVNSKQWNDRYTSWERIGDSWESGNNVFDKNPFYELKYTPQFVPIKNPIRLNKYTVTRQLINYLNKAEDVKNKDRDYYYFLVANCYYNMTQYGNCWMMRRYYAESVVGTTILEDENEFHGCLSAKRYYQLAYKNAKTDKFKALCLKMIAKCENFRLENESSIYNYHGDYKDYDAMILSKNRYYQDLKLKYPKYFDELTSDCTYFEDYFKARR